MPRNFYCLGAAHLLLLREKRLWGRAPRKVRGVGESINQTLVWGLDDREQRVSWGLITPLPMPSFFPHDFAMAGVPHEAPGRCTWLPNPQPLSHLPPHIISLGHPSSPAPSILYPVSNLDWWFVSYMIVYMFQCHSPKSSHLLPLLQSPKVCSIHLCLFCCLVYRVVITIFLNSVYMCQYTVLVFFFLAYFTLYNWLLNPR